MSKDWVPFLEAIYRMSTRLIIPEFTAKPLLRDAVRSGRVAGRGEYREKGEVIFTFSSDRSNPDNDPNVIREGSLYFKAEVYPGEVRLDELGTWIGTLEEDGRHRALSGKNASIAEGLSHLNPQDLQEKTSEAKPRTAHWDAIDFAVGLLGDQLMGIAVQRRDHMIRETLREHKKTVPHERTIRRYYKGQKTIK